MPCVPGDRPLLLVDVDGVISLFGFDQADPPPGRFALVEGIGHYLSLEAAPLLLELGEVFELAWCTGWEERANEHLPHLLGLPRPLGLVELEPGPRPPGAHWKLDGIDRRAGPDRPLAWIDDSHDARTRRWAAARLGPTLLVDADPAEGLTRREVRELLGWTRRLNER